MTPSAIQAVPAPPAPPRGVRVVQVSTTDCKGGAAKAALRLHRALPAENAESRMLVAQRFTAEPGVAEYNPLPIVPARVGRALFRLARRWHRPPVRRAGAYFSPDWTLVGGGLARRLADCDVAHLHWVADFVDYGTLPRLAARVPLVWTFHDMNAFTGGCHYSGPCERYRERCGSCPQLRTSSGDVDMTRRVLERKRRIFARIPRRRLTVVCPSEWLAREARRSALIGGFDVRVIPNGLDLREYRPMPRDEARLALGLPAEARVVLFVADAIEDRRKGLRPMIEALRALGDLPGVLLVTLGRGDSALLSGPQFRQLGPWEDSAKLRAAYSAADVFAIPSLQDNLPNTVLEAMACGIPVAGFAAGGIGEAVVDGRTGLLATTGDAGALAGGIRRLLQDRALRRELGAAARERAEREYSSSLLAARYAALYREVVEAQEVA